MWKFKFRIVLFFIAKAVCFVSSSDDAFHVNSKITFRPDQDADYFGYSVLLNGTRLYVGAPKAKNRTATNSSPGDVFICPLDNLGSSDVTCYPKDKGRKRLGSYIKPEYFNDDMWFGATMAVGDKYLLVCAPHLIESVGDKLVTHGACFVYDKDSEYRLFEINNDERPLYVKYGGDKDYGEYNQSLSYYAHGQIGMSITFTKDDHLVIGAPGILQWTGVTLNCKKTAISIMELSTINPAYTKELDPDGYFGYSVESGIFEVNGTVLHVASAPRAKKTYGEVIIFQPNTRSKVIPLHIKAKLRGPQLGAYFGAALCTLDLNGDGVSDLLVGAPNYVMESGESTRSYDQGAVFVYITKVTESGFILEESGYVRGSGNSRARFGSTIAELGDIDGDGITDVAIGAPWDNNGTGVVYIYRGTPHGLQMQEYQKIHPRDAMGFGMSISKGYDVDNNGFNDLAIGAHNSRTAYIYRTIPTMQVNSFIKLPMNAKELWKDANHFVARFCISVPLKRLNDDYQIDLKGNIIITNTEGMVIRKNNILTVRPGDITCEEQLIGMDHSLDTSKPIKLEYTLESYRNLDKMAQFPEKRARLSADSKLYASENIRVDCGDDLICTPWLELTVEPLDGKSVYIPGTGSRLGAKITINNLKEPGYGVKLHVVLPYPPQRLPSSCSLQNMEVICNLTEPLNRNQTIYLDVELEYSWDGTGKEMTIKADLEDLIYQRNISSGAKELKLTVSPQSSYDYTVKPQSDTTVVITKDAFNRSEDVLFRHYYELTNHGPTDLYNLKIEFLLSEEVSPGIIEDAIFKNRILTLSPSKLAANTTMSLELPLRFNLSKYGKLLEDNGELKLSSEMSIHVQYGFTKNSGTRIVTTSLSIEQTPLWPMIVGILLGLLLLAGIILALYKYGFFSRQKLKNSEESNAQASDEPSTSQPLL